MKRTYSVGCLMLASLALAFGGCTSDSVDGLVAVKGSVKKEGKAVEGASVIFMASGGFTAFGATDAEGNFTLSTRNQKGATPGTYKVLITKSKGGDASSVAPAATPGKETPPTVAPTSGGPPPPAEAAASTNELNPKYATQLTTPFEKVVDKDPAKNVFDFDLEP